MFVCEVEERVASAEVNSGVCGYQTRIRADFDETSGEVALGAIRQLSQSPSLFGELGKLWALGRRCAHGRRGRRQPGGDGALVSMPPTLRSKKVAGAPVG